jgi:hypothetical protein
VVLILDVRMQSGGSVTAVANHVDACSTIAKKYEAAEHV